MSAERLRTEEQLAQVARAMNRCVPPLIARSTVAIVGSKDRVLRQLGSGTLLALADHRFFVTAAHVLRQASETEATVGISGTKDGRFVAASGNWMLSGDKGGTDEHDVAVYSLNPRQGERFAGSAFVRVADVAFDFNAETACFVVSGFPAMWSTPMAPSDDTMTSKMLQYGTFALQGSTAGLEGFHPRRHFLLEASPSDLLDGEGQRTAVRTRTGFPAQMPHDLVGVSGCSVWTIGDFSLPIDTWQPAHAKLVGVETSVYKSRRAIKATRWSSVASLLYAAVPDVRPVLEMYERFWS